MRGVQIAIDGLGSGTSSLFSLLRVPATHIKVDGHFVRQMLIDPEAMAIVCLGLDLGRRADLQFVATGVNSAELITALQQCGCDTAQGPYLVRPLLADEVPLTSPMRRRYQMCRMLQSWRSILGDTNLSRDFRNGANRSEMEK